MRRVHVTVTGEVQGVGYRYSMRAIATRAGASGWVRNLRDGRVEAEVEGADAAVEAVLAWMAKGPPGGHVAGVDARGIPPISDSGFEVRRDG